MEIITPPLECWKTTSASTQWKQGRKSEWKDPQHIGLVFTYRHSMWQMGPWGSPCFWLPLHNADVLETTTKQGPAAGTFVSLCYIHRPFLHLLLRRPHGSREARAEVLAAHLGSRSQRQTPTLKLGWPTCWRRVSEEARLYLWFWTQGQTDWDESVFLGGTLFETRSSPRTKRFGDKLLFSFLYSHRRLADLTLTCNLN